MEREAVLPFSVVSVVEDVLHKHGSRLSDINLASRKAEEASLRRKEAVEWLRKTIGDVGWKDLPDEPSEEDFRMALRSGIILCNALNKIKPGAVPKVVEVPEDIDIIPDGAALSVYQYFENVRNFLVVVHEMRLPTFEASDLEQGGKTSRIVNCVLALKAYSEGKPVGQNVLSKYGGIGNPKLHASVLTMMMRKSEPFARSLSRAMSLSNIRDDLSPRSDLGHDQNEGESMPSLNTLVREYLADKKKEEIPILVESLLGKVMEEVESRMLTLQETIKVIQEDKASADADNSNLKTVSDDEEMGEQSDQLLKQQNLIREQHENIQELKSTVHETKEGLRFLQRTYQEEIIILSKQVHRIAYAASGYDKVLEENRKLYNEVQDLKGNIRVYCRVRPLKGGDPNNHGSVCNIDEESITLAIPSKQRKEGKKTFTFNKVFGPSVTQAEVFSDTEPLIRSILDGYNVCIFAYGQTGSGKTHTMTGPNNYNEETVGVNYRALRDLFLLSEQRNNIVDYSISVQMLEIYNEQVRDLLAPAGSGPKKLEIRNNSHNGINVPDANLVPVSSTSDVLRLMELGHKNRAVGSTAMNDRSSRSHSCLTVHVQGRNLLSGNNIRSCMHLVDLAGSERVDKSEVTGDRLKEAQHINKSLSAFGDVIASLAQKQSHVPYRNSKLTQLLQDSLGGQAKTLMFVHINPEPDAIGETISTLKFAERASTVQLGAARVNKEKESADVKELKEQIAKLKATLARKEEEVKHFRRLASRIDEMPMSPASQSSSPMPPRDYYSSSLEDQVNIKEDDKESVFEGWIDKSMKRNASLNSNDSVGQYWDVESQLTSMASTMLSCGQCPDSPKLCVDVVSTNGCDEIESSSSEFSELDMNWQPHLPKATGVSKGLTIKTNKTSPHLRQQAKNYESRSVISSPRRTFMSSPSRSMMSSSPRAQPIVASQPRKHTNSIIAKIRRTGKAK